MGIWVQSIEILEGGQIVARMKGIDQNIDEGIAEKTIIFTPVINEDALEWDCFSGTIPYKFRPSECRK